MVPGIIYSPKSIVSGKGGGAETGRAEGLFAYVPSLFREGNFPVDFPFLCIGWKWVICHCPAHHWQKKRITITDLSLGDGDACI